MFKSSLKVWKLAKTRNEKAGLVATFVLTTILWLSYTAPFVIALLAGAPTMHLLLAAIGIYAMRRAVRGAALTVGEMMERRMHNEHKDLIEAKLRELFDKARDGKASNVFELPTVKKAGGLN